jgi:hypothetical protein
MFQSEIVSDNCDDLLSRKSFYDRSCQNGRMALRISKNRPDTNIDDLTSNLGTLLDYDSELGSEIEHAQIKKLGKTQSYQ